MEPEPYRFLSRSPASIRSAYDVLVAGSGYGASIAASRCARAGKSVCVLERGREIAPGDYPKTKAGAAEHIQFSLPHARKGPPTGLFEFHVSDDIDVLVGCGLGGTSLINANVSLRAEKRVFEDARWPRALAADYETSLEEGYRRAESMLRPVVYPEELPEPSKSAAHRASAEGLGHPHLKTPLNVHFGAAGRNHADVHQEPCNGCGDCVTGCNVRAKNTLLMNYLPDAANFGAQIFTEAEVDHVERREGEWAVFFRWVGSGQEKFGDALFSVRAPVVFLGAGSLGTTGILLRSQEAGLRLSPRVGKAFTGNGDFLAFAYNADRRIAGVGLGARRPSGRDAGPCITGAIDARGTQELDEGMIIEEGSLPGAMGPMLARVFAKAASLLGTDTDRGLLDRLRERAREFTSLLGGPYRGAVAHTQTFLVMAHEHGAGEIYLKSGRPRVRWPEVGHQPVFQRIEKALRTAAEALGATYLPNPAWNDFLGKKPVTVHPLGGCPLGDGAQTGAVSHKGQVFSGETGDAVHDGLYVCDGAVIPRSLGVNPLLTISALAERCAALAAADRGWTIDYDAPSRRRPEDGQRRDVGVRFTERMTGWISTFRLEEGFEAAADDGRSLGEAGRCSFTLTIEAEDLYAFLADPEHEARLSGTVRAPAFGARPMMATDGRFQLFVRDEDDSQLREMRYSMRLERPDGGLPLFLSGFKRIRDDRRLGTDLWPDTTTLYASFREGAADGQLVAKGVLRIRPDDFLRQLATLDVLNARDLPERVRAVRKFGAFFAGSLARTFGGPLRPDSPFNPAAPPRDVRPLSASPPEIFSLAALDGAQLRLTRYRGGDRGPVMLVHGLGVSSLIFRIDTIPVNLVEYLHARGFDVWCLDFRVSVDLPEGERPWTGDDAASSDFPAAVDFIRRTAGAESIQAVVHCFGSTCFLMSMLRGLQGVRSIVCSQIAAHVDGTPMTRLKTGLFVPEFLDRLGIDQLDAYTDAHADWQDRLFNAALRLYPNEFEELCDSPVCRRIAFMYAPLYEHDQLNTATHSAMHEMFGVASMAAFKHIAQTVRRGRLVDAAGKDSYLTDENLPRLDLPIAFIHGEQNACFRPSSTEKTYELLRRSFDPDQYQRHVIRAYGHIDCIFGARAHLDVFPLIASALEQPGGRPAHT